METTLASEAALGLRSLQMRAEALSFAFRSAVSLLHNIPDRVGVIYRPIYEENANSPELPPLNITDQVLPRLASVATRHSADNRATKPYWDDNLQYDPIEVLGATVQSVDLHDAPLPHTVFPPEADVQLFIDAVKGRPHRVGVDEQLDIALDVTEGNLLGALNICWISNRFMARGADQRLYPTIPMHEELLRDWNHQVAQFETDGKSGKNDGPGDNYYFWTHAFAAMAFSRRGLQASLAQAAFSRGTRIMEFVRKNISTGDQPNITAHEPASTLGRQAGLFFAGHRYMDVHKVGAES